MTAQIVRLKPWPYPSNPEDQAQPEWSPIAGAFVAREHGPKPLAITIAGFVRDGVVLIVQVGFWIFFLAALRRVVGF